MPNVLCAWCGALIGQSEAEDSHGICRTCYRDLRGIPDLSSTELDGLPFGVIVLAEHGTILAYNQAESRLAKREPLSVIGRNFFTEIAPCTSVQAFLGAFREFCHGNEPSRTFQFTFPFPDGPVRVVIVFLHKGKDVTVAVRKCLGQNA
ncbi:PAS domain-containing protein [Geothrix fuzhouensis]|uniref:PAS domain-containing protein n=1 Tax=Geothrix fuzhouensis TaxID=2966451 RepID=UPI0021475DD6|nr:PAS domain-containing protein [Geothrix fuzhouensis]